MHSYIYILGASVAASIPCQCIVHVKSCSVETKGPEMQHDLHDNIKKKLIHHETIFRITFFQQDEAQHEGQTWPNKHE